MVKIANGLSIICKINLLFVVPFSEESVQIEPGVYTFGFECDLPRDLPTSCEGKFGFIRYLASVQVIRSKEPEQLQGCPFTVIKPYNLNADPIVQVRSCSLIKQFIEKLIRANKQMCYQVAYETKGNKEKRQDVLKMSTTAQTQ